MTDNSTYKELKSRIRRLERENKELLKSRQDIGASESLHRIIWEKEVTQKQKMLETVFEGISDPLIMLDRQMKVKIVNTVAKKYYDLNPRDYFQNICCFKLFKQKDEPCHGCRIPSAISSNEFLCYEREGLEDPDRFEQVSIYPVAGSFPEEQCFIVRISDITPLRKNELKLAHADKMISMGVLVSGVTHEVNNPNNFILMNSQILLDSFASIEPILDQYYNEHGDFSMGGLPFTEMRNEVPGLIKGIEKSSNRIKQIISELKAFARNDEGRMDESVEINQAIQNAVTFTDKLIKDATDSFEITFDQAIPVIQGNKQQLEQVIINLIQNACQAITDKGMGISIVSFMDTDQDLIRIDVRDQGMGIAPHVISIIMDPFFTTRRNSGGTGLGLSVSDNIIKKHGGSILVESREGIGTEFSILLPLFKSDEKFKVLIVDDDPGSRTIFKKILLRARKFNVWEAGNGTEALFKIGQLQPDLIIIDVHMPGVDGAEVCRLIKAKPELSQIKVLVTTGFMSSPKVEKIVKLGFDIFLEKPIDTKLLLTTIDTMLEFRP